MTQKFKVGDVVRVRWNKMEGQEGDHVRQDELGIVERIHVGNFVRYPVGVRFIVSDEAFNYAESELEKVDAD